MDGSQLLTLIPVSMPPGQPILSIDPGTIDGAVAELAVRDDGTITAEIRIPARQPEGM